MIHEWATKEPEGRPFEANAEGFKQRCFTFLYILCNDKDMKKAGAYLSPDCVLVHEDGAWQGAQWSRPCLGLFPNQWYKTQCCSRQR